MKAESIELAASTHAKAQARAKAVIFNDPRSRALLKEIERVAPSDASVLVRGETGTGKELIARHLHAYSKRSGPFVAVNCGALTASLVEAELFGHQQGAFTGASETRAGWFEAANGGTLFLDEVGDLPLAIQVKLLRVLQEREVVRVGSRKSIPIDVRVVAATNVNLAQAVAEGSFRLDLYYRLSVVTLDLPPLRERRGDIVPLFEHFLRNYSERAQTRQPVLAPPTQARLLAHGWPGNIRELENVAYAALLLADTGVIQPEHVRFSAVPQLPGVATAHGEAPLDVIRTQLDRLFAARPADLHQELEELIVRRAFDHCRNNQVHTAKLLGVTRNVLRTLLKRYELISSEVQQEDEDAEDTEPARLGRSRWTLEATSLMHSSG